MKKIIIATSILLTLTACGSKTVYVTDTEVPNSPETTVKVVKTTDAPIATPAPTQAPAVWTDEDEFIADIYNENSGPIYLEDYDLIETGYAVCEGLRSGGPQDSRPTTVFTTSSVEVVRSRVADRIGVTFLYDMMYRP